MKYSSPLFTSMHVQKFSRKFREHYGLLHDKVELE